MEVKDRAVVAKPPPAEPSPLSVAAQVGMVSIVASVISTFLIRVAARTSFVILSFYIGKESESAALVVLVIEAFYISELLIAPIVGVLSDRYGRKRYMLYAPITGAIASLVLALTSFIFPTPRLSATDVNLELISILFLVLTGRLLEGTAAAYNAPSNLGYLTDVTTGNEKLRVRVLTAYQVATISGIALAIPFGGQVWSYLGRTGFFVAVVIYALCFAVIAIWMKDSVQRTHEEGEAHGSLKDYRMILSNKRIFTFVPAWLAINALIGAWLTLTLIVLSYPTSECRVVPANSTENIRPAMQIFAANYCAPERGVKDADARFPDQLLHGGFLPSEASNLVGIFGFFFILGMGGWTFFVTRIRRTTTMMIGLGGLMVSCIGMTLINLSGNNPLTISPAIQTQVFILALIVLAGIVVMSGFTPAALTHLASISETMPGKRGAVMGLYSVLLGLGQLIGVFIGGLFVDLQGFTGMMIYSVILVLVSLGSVAYMRSHNHDIDDTAHVPAITVLE